MSASVAGSQVGAYRVLTQIGEGGMGAVWLAEHAMLGRRAAIKLLHPMYSAQPEIVQRFFNEARAATAIADPGIVQIFDFGYHTDGSAYIVMELLDGETLSARLRRVGRMQVGEALRIMRQVATSLGAAHVRGIIHRDLKPENLFMVRDPEVPGGERPKILDFGIAKLGGDPSVKTQTSAIMGTPLYMSPEQCRGAGQVDQRSDVYAMGCVLFHLLAGAPPFVAEGQGEIIASHLREQAPRVATRAPNISPAVDDFVARCLEKEPVKRFASASELASQLAVVLARQTNPGFSAPQTGTGSGMAATVASTTLSGAAGSRLEPPPRRSRALVIGLGVGVLVVGSITVAVLASSDTKPTTAAASEPATLPPPAAVADAAIEKPDPDKLVATRMKEALGGFVTWSRDHAGAACPDAATIGAPDDPWGHPMMLTCTDQPANQKIGVMSAGPDGKLDTQDDVASWQLGRETADLVRGPRWIATAALASGSGAGSAVVSTKAVTTKKQTPKHTTTTQTTTLTTAGKKTDPASQTPKGGIQVDENGMPISR